MTTLLAFTAPPSITDFTGGISIFGNDYRSAVTGTITGVWYYHTSSNEGANAGVAVHRVSDQFLMGSKSFATGGLTDNTWNLITLDSPITYAVANQLVCLSIHYPTGMGFSFTDGLNDLTVGDLTVIRSTYRFDNVGNPVLGDFPVQNGANVGFSAGIEFVAGGSGHAKGAEFLPFF
jgi:hypothetical protein